jgi:hypothetical protein
VLLANAIGNNLPGNSGEIVRSYSGTPGAIEKLEPPPAGYVCGNMLINIMPEKKE